MKKSLSILALAIAIIACNQAPKDYVTLSGKITEKNSDSLIIAGKKGILKKINVNEDGTFSDTLKIETGNYMLFDGKEQGTIHLQNGYDLTIFFDTKEWDETLTYTGNGAVANNYLAKKALYSEKAFSDQGMWKLEEGAFETKVNEIAAGFNKLIADTKDLDLSFIEAQNKEISDLKKGILGQYKSMKEEKSFFTENLAKGSPSPKFTDYENHAGGNMSLDDLKGKYVYIDMWATWCGPCKREIPFLKEVEKAYHGKNIAFVSISVDRKKDYDTWRKMVTEKELTGIQLYSKEDRTFGDAYKVNGIPRFILIDTEGNIIDANAPRPSDEKLKTLFNSLNI